MRAYGYIRPINARSFRAWVENCLVPSLRQGDIVVMEAPST
jgi:prophage antirepressor-like protein